MDVFQIRQIFFEGFAILEAGFRNLNLDLYRRKLLEYMLKTGFLGGVVAQW